MMSFSISKVKHEMMENSHKTQQSIYQQSIYLGSGSGIVCNKIEIVLF